MEEAEPQVFTYHCMCSHLVLASSTSLEGLDRRSAGSLDKEYILPLTASSAAVAGQGDASAGRERRHYAVLLSVLLDRKARVVARSDGFEKRWLQRCGRCKSTVGYQLDHEQFREPEPGKSGRREDVVYLLTNSLQTTSEMMEAEQD